MKTTNTWLKRLILTLLFISISACSGGSSSTIEDKLVVTPPEEKTCTTSDEENDNDDCGSLIVSITDADGDFLTYSVNITAIELNRRDGTVVSLLPTAQTVDFTDYLELSELTTAATIPAGIYTSGSISFDYSNADIQVEKDGAAVSATMVDENGEVLLSQTLALQIDQDNNLIVSRARLALMEFDFNLAASHTIDLEADPVTITTEPFIIIEVDPVDSKKFRIRGPLISVNEVESLYRIAVRPFNGNSDRFGGLNVHINDETNFDINDEAFVGSAGLTAMAALDERTATVAFGIFNRAQATFTASIVVAGSSVAGSERDAARGVIIARNGNTLTLKGASLIRQNGSVTYEDEITVLVSDSTLVRKHRRIQDEVTIADLSVGQAVTVHGIYVTDAVETVLDATDGAVKMKLTFASGHIVSKAPSLLTLDLQALSGRRVDLYDFSGTGTDETFDADADNYEVSIMNQMANSAQENDPVRVAGFVAPFGSAPADFDALVVTNYANARSQLFVDWPEAEDILAFSEITSDSLTINIATEIEGGIYKLIQGGIRTELTSFDNAVVIQPLAARGIYALRTESGVTVFSNFAEFTAELELKLEEGLIIDKMHATGGFSANTTTFSALKLAIKLN